MWIGKGWKKSNGSSAADCEFTVNSVVSRGVLWASLGTSFDAFPVIDAGADHLQEAVLGAVGVAGSWRASVRAQLNPMRWSNGRMGSSPASPESWPGDGSITSGVPKKSRHWGQAAAMLMAIPVEGKRPDDSSG